MRILVINPNTSAYITDMVVASCARAQPGVTWQGVTSALGAAYIASEVSYALAAHAALDAYAVHFDGHDAVLVACFGDPGLLALQEIARVPVVGLAQASFVAAAGRGPFAVVTGGAAWGPMLARFARMHGLGGNLVGIHTVELTGVEIAAAPEQAMDSLLAAARLGMDAGARSIVLGGAALAGMAGALQERVGMPVLDNVLLGAHVVVEAATRGLGAAPRAGAPAPVSGLGPALTRLLRTAAG